MAALPNLLRHVKAPVYSTPLTAMLIEEMLKKEGLREIRVHRVKRNSSFKIAGIPIRTFGMTQSSNSRPASACRSKNAAGCDRLHERIRRRLRYS